MKKILILLLLASLLIINAACTKSESVSSNEMISGSEIILDGDMATYEGEGVIIESGKIRIEKSGSYELKGNYTGEILVDAGDEAEVQLILNGASLNSTEDSAIYVKSSLKTTIALKDGTNNSISDSSSFIEESEDESENGAIYSKSDLIINGGGTLDINSENKNGIKSKETIEISDGEITITSPADGLNTNEGIEIIGGAISITAGDDGIHSEKTVAIAGGQVDILDSEEGIEGLDIVIDGGEININSNDDGINVAGDTEVLTGHGLIINGGNLTVTSEGDGLDSNGDITMYGGTVIVNGPTMTMNGSIDYNGTFNIEGGELMAGGSSSMVQGPSESSSINSIVIGFTENLPKGTIINLIDENGKNILMYSGAKNFQSLVIASSLIEDGKSYEIYIGDQLYETANIEGSVTQIGSIAAGGPGGGRPGMGEMPPMGEMPRDGEMPPMGERPADGEMPAMGEMPDASGN